MKKAKPKKCQPAWLRIWKQKDTGIQEKRKMEQEMKAPTADEIFTAATKLKRREYHIEDAGRVWIHRLAAFEARQVFKSMDRDDEGLIDDPYDDARVIMRCVCDDEGNQIFSSTDLPKIITMGNDVVLGLVTACLSINGMTEKGREEIVKNSETTPASGSESE